MNVKQILTIFVISLLIFLSSCNSMKRQMDTYQEKIGKKDDDYSLSYYKTKRALVKSILNIKIFEGDGSLSTSDLYLHINGVPIISNYKEANFYLSPNKKYDVQVTTFSGYKGVYINNIKMKEKDSVVLNVYLKEPALIFCE
ncbi:hypothetical protein JMN10_03605 [Capnocytophaga genosp. AHN8471]|uniref:Lipoprotein n=2 Tax=Capnocytophaga genosp. AHN8471 TaxID=327574 RepID=A0ABS1YSJ8_9FLAO|nr:hypothetical protein [Capnocytophaga genosp. AHN8471]MBM0661278.1 hypothetical protein [Capnocytophaga genosp. AHN8471]